MAQSAPIWWALGDALSDVARDYLGALGAGAMAQLGQFVPGHVGVVVGVSAVGMVPAIEAVILFGSWRFIPAWAGNTDHTNPTSLLQRRRATGKMAAFSLLEIDRTYIQGDPEHQ